MERIEREMRDMEGPGGCRSEEECDAFCRNPDNAQVCMNFAVKEGRISQEEADFMAKRMRMHREGPYGPPGGPPGGPPHGPPGPGGPGGPPSGPQIDEEKAMELIATIGGPGGCSTMQECDVFCSTPGNDEVCINYAIEHGLMPEDEIERVKEMMNMEGPGGCRGRECEAYCSDPAHQEECFEFAVEQGFIDPDEAEEARKFMKITKQGGPGGCMGPQECDIYCSNPDNGDECFEFGKQHGLIPQGEMEIIEKEMEIMKQLDVQGGPGDCRGPMECQQYCADPAHFDECAAFSVKEGMMDPGKAKEMLREFMDIEERKFERYGPPGFGPPGPMGPMDQMMGPSMMGGEFGPPDFSAEGGPASGWEEKFQERFEMFEKHQEEFEKHDEFCADPGNFEKCRQFGPGMMPPPDIMGPDMMPQDMMPMPMPMQPGEFPHEGFPPPGEFPGMHSEFPGMPGEFPPPSYEESPWVDDFIKEGEAIPIMDLPPDWVPPEHSEIIIMPPEGDYIPPTIPPEYPGDYMQSDFIPHEDEVPMMPMEPMMEPMPMEEPMMMEPMPAPIEPMPIEGPQSGNRLQSLLGAIIYPLQGLLR